jgi:hypothetical protein
VGKDDGLGYNNKMGQMGHKKLVVIERLSFLSSLSQNDPFTSFMARKGQFTSWNQQIYKDNIGMTEIRGEMGLILKETDDSASDRFVVYAIADKGAYFIATTRWSLESKTSQTSPAHPVPPRRIKREFVFFKPSLIVGESAVGSAGMTVSAMEVSVISSFLELGYRPRGR